MNNLANAFTQIRRTPYQALAAVLLTTITFFIVSVFSLLALGTNEALKYLESRPQVTAFFYDQATQESVDTLRAKIEATGVTEEVKYISKEEALSIYQEQNQDNPLLLEMVTADILPASLEVSAVSVSDLESIASIMQSDTNVEEVVYQKDVIDTLKRWTSGIKAAGISLSGIFLFASIMTITVIIGLKTASKKEEINTLSLLGATKWYIKKPFLFEGITYGIIGSFLGWSLSYLILLYLTPNLIEFLANIPLLPVSPVTMLLVLASQLFLGIIVGAIASLVATRRYGR